MQAKLAIEMAGKKAEDAYIKAEKDAITCTDSDSDKWAHICGTLQRQLKISIAENIMHQGI